MQDCQSIAVQVDDRESRSGVLEALRDRPEVQVQVGRLALGDYLVDDAFLFERKTLVDLALSIKDGRLFSQGLRLAVSPLRTALILEGTSRDLAACRMRREAIQGALVSLTLFAGLPLLRSMDPGETARLMLFAARQGRRFAADALPRKGRRPVGKRRLQSRLLQGLPGIGPTRAGRLLQRFGSIEAVVTAAPDDLAAIEGIGPTIAKAIRWVVEEPPARFGPEEEDFFTI